MPIKPVTRRRFLRAATRAMLYGGPVAAAANAFWWEPRRIRVKTVRLARNRPAPGHRLVHFSDVHFKGDEAHFETAVRRINALSPDFVCFTGDLIEESPHSPRGLDILKGIKAPVYGVSGNHDHWSGASFQAFEDAFAATGGAWLEDRQIADASGRVLFTGLTAGLREPSVLQPQADVANILLMHFPGWVEKLRSGPFDLILAGHSHGGQIRLPIAGSLIVPYNVGRFDLGLYETASGPMYVNPGIGWFKIAARFLCPPEITVIEF